MPTFITPRPIAATVQVAGAHVRVTASDRADTVVRVAPVNHADPSHVRVADRTKVDFAASHLSVKTTVSGERARSVAITIDVPTGSSLVTYLAHSDVHADGAFGDCEVHMAHGRVELDRIDALQANAAAGDIAIRCAHGSVTAATASGAIRIGRLTRGRADLSTGSGDIEIGIGEGTQAWVDATSERGSVRNSVPSHGNPVASDQLMVHARTRHGDIDIHPAASVTVTNSGQLA